MGGGPEVQTVDGEWIYAEYKPGRYNISKKVSSSTSHKKNKFFSGIFAEFCLAHSFINQF